MKIFRLTSICVIIFVAFGLTGCVRIEKSDESVVDTEAENVDPGTVECLVKNADGTIGTAPFPADQPCPALSIKCSKIIRCERGATFPAERLNRTTNQCETINYPTGGPCFEGVTVPPQSRPDIPSTIDTDDEALDQDNATNIPDTITPTPEPEPVSPPSTTTKTCEKVVVCQDGTVLPAQEFNPISGQCEDLSFAGGTPCFNESGAPTIVNRGGAVVTNDTDLNFDNVVEVFKEGDGQCARHVRCADGREIPIEEFNPNTRQCVTLDFAFNTPCFQDNFIP